MYKNCVVRETEKGNQRKNKNRKRILYFSSARVNT